MVWDAPGELASCTIRYLSCWVSSGVLKKARGCSPPSIVCMRTFYSSTSSQLLNQYPPPLLLPRPPCCRPVYPRYRHPVGQRGDQLRLPQERRDVPSPHRPLRQVRAPWSGHQPHHLRGPPQPLPHRAGESLGHLLRCFAVVVHDCSALWRLLRTREDLVRLKPSFVGDVHPKDRSTHNAVPSSVVLCSRGLLLTAIMVGKLFSSPSGTWFSASWSCCC